MIYDNQIENLTATYNSYDLNSSANELKVLSIDATNAPQTVINQYKLVRQDGEVVTNSEFGKRIIKIEGRLNGTSKDNLDSRIDTLKSNLVGIDNNLDLTINGITRRFIATVQNTSYEYKTGCVCLWTIEFTCAAFGKNTSSTALTFGTYTASNTTYTNTIAGSYKSNAIMTLVASKIVPYWQAAYINIENAVANERIRLTRTWDWFDTVTINGDDKSVTLYPTTKTVIDDMDSLTGWTAGPVTTLDNCDSITGWTASSGTLALETINIIEGTGAIKITMSFALTTLVWSKLNFTPAVSLTTAAGYVIVPVFIPTPTSGSVASMRLTIGSNTTLVTNMISWTVTQQYDGTAITNNAWNYFEIDLNSVGTTTGTPVRTSIISWSITLNATTTMQLPGAIIDFLTNRPTSITLGILSLNTTTNAQGTGALSMTMSSAGAEMNNFTKLNFATALDMNSSAGYVIIPIFIPTPTSGTVASVKLTIGSNSTLVTNTISWTNTLQWDGSAIANNAWNYFKIDLASVGTTTGTPVRTAIISLSVTLTATATMLLVGALLDYTTIQLASIIGQAMDYEGTFPDLNIGSCSLIFTDEFDSRSIAITGSYYKRYI